MPLAHATNTLLKQLLVMNETDTFNWVANVLGITKQTNAHVFESLWGDSFERIPAALGERFGKELNSFEEVVFEMNMMETQFDVLDLFLYIYIFDGALFKGMRNATELLEFFNLPFKWEELDKMSPNWGRK